MNTMLLRYFQTAVACISIAAILTPSPASSAALHRSHVERTTYMGFPAYRITDGHTEAVAAPAIGRIMRFGLVGGPNLLWNAPAQDFKPGQWRNYGGEKNWLAPQSSWKQFHGSDIWPPDPAFDGRPYTSRILPGGKFEMTSPLSPGTGVRFVRTLSFDEHTGDFVIDEKAIKSIGALIDASIWSVAQITGGDWIVLPVNPRSAYKDGYANIQESLPPDAAKRVGDDLLYIAPSYKDHCKIGLDANSATIVTITGRTAFVQSASPPTEGAVYPDGIGGPGFPVELYIGDNQQQFYCELELLSPMTNAVAGKSWSQTIRWRVALLPAGSADSPEVAKAVRSLIY